MLFRTYFELLRLASPGKIEDANQGNGCSICMKPCATDYPYHKGAKYLRQQHIEDILVSHRASTRGTKNPNSGRDTEAQCAIPVSLSCGHIFGYGCITTWFRRLNPSTNLTCPVCRAQPTALYHIYSAQVQQRLRAYETQYNIFANPYSCCLRYRKYPFVLEITPRRLSNWGRDIQALMLSLLAEQPFGLQPNAFLRCMHLFCSSWAAELCLWVAGKETLQDDEPVQATLMQLQCIIEGRVQESVQKGQVFERGFRPDQEVLRRFRRFFVQVLGRGINHQLNQLKTIDNPLRNYVLSARD